MYIFVQQRIHFGFVVELFSTFTGYTPVQNCILLGILSWHALSSLKKVQQPPNFPPHVDKNSKLPYWAAFGAAFHIGRLWADPCSKHRESDCIRPIPEGRNVYPISHYNALYYFRIFHQKKKQKRIFFQYFLPLSVNFKWEFPKNKSAEPANPQGLSAPVPFQSKKRQATFLSTCS